MSRIGCPHTISPRYDRVAHLPERAEYSLYIAELSGGWVKVGYTGKPRDRMKSLICDFDREFSRPFGRFEIFYGAGGYKEERKALSKFRSVFEKAHKDEYFIADFESAVSLMSKITSEWNS